MGLCRLAKYKIVLLNYKHSSLPKALAKHMRRLFSFIANCLTFAAIILMVPPATWHQKDGSSATQILPCLWQAINAETSLAVGITPLSQIAKRQRRRGAIKTRVQAWVNAKMFYEVRKYQHKYLKDKAQTKTPTRGKTCIQNKTSKEIWIRCMHMTEKQQNNKRPNACTKTCITNAQL